LEVNPAPARLWREPFRELIFPTKDEIGKNVVIA